MTNWIEKITFAIEVYAQEYRRKNTEIGNVVECIRKCAYFRCEDVEYGTGYRWLDRLSNQVLNNSLFDQA